MGAVRKEREWNSTDPYFQPHRKCDVEEGLQYAIIAEPPKGKKPTGKFIAEFRNRFAAMLRKNELEGERGVVLYVWDRVQRKVIA